MLILSEKVKEKNLISALNIYNYYILNSFSNFEEKKLSIKSYQLRDISLLYMHKK